MMKNLQIEVTVSFKLLILTLCTTVSFLSSIKFTSYNCRFISLQACLNTLPRVSNRTTQTDRLRLILSILSYITVFDLHFIVFLPSEFFKIKLDIKPRIEYPCKLLKIFRCLFVSITVLTCKTTGHIIHMNLAYLCNNPHVTFSLWYILLRLKLSSDVHPNPGPVDATNNFSGGFLSFCNWNLNTLSKEDFYRITLLEAHNSNHNYDIISLTSLNDAVQVPENALPGYKFHSCNHPDGNRSGGVGIFYKETLPLRIRQDLSFEEYIVTEMIFGRK